jgi:hypothetical protein
MNKTLFREQQKVEQTSRSGLKGPTEQEAEKRRDGDRILFQTILAFTVKSRSNCSKFVKDNFVT